MVQRFAFLNIFSSRDSNFIQIKQRKNYIDFSLPSKIMFLKVTLYDFFTFDIHITYLIVAKMLKIKRIKNHSNTNMFKIFVRVRKL